MVYLALLDNYEKQNSKLPTKIKANHQHLLRWKHLYFRNILNGLKNLQKWPNSIVQEYFKLLIRKILDAFVRLNPGHGSFDVERPSGTVSVVPTLGLTCLIAVLDSGFSEYPAEALSKKFEVFFESIKDTDQDGKITFEEFAKRYNINLLEDTERVNAYQGWVPRTFDPYHQTCCPKIPG